MDGSPARQLPTLLSPDLLAEADRILTICNACRYCEGVCAVFPALERRTSFAEPDVLFLGNLCHDCRACYYVCPYTEPHAFAVNVPAVMSEVRVATYAGYAWPTALAEMLSRGWRGIGVVFGILMAVIAIAITQYGTTGLLEASSGPGAFYTVLPWLLMFVPALVMSGYAVAVILVAASRFWRSTATDLRSLGDPRAALDAARDALGLRYLAGGGPGCYVEERPSQRRRIAHSLVFYGFVGTFVATVAASFQQEVLGWLPPYALLSIPVLAGTIGGIAGLIGCADLLRLKARSDDRMAARAMLDLDVVFLVVLLLLNADGLVLLALRETVLMPLLLATHLALVGAFFITAPYGKFAHFIFRYGALVQERIEARAENALEAERKAHGAGHVRP